MFIKDLKGTDMLIVKIINKVQTQTRSLADVISFDKINQPHKILHKL